MATDFIELSKIKANPKNPRTLSDQKYNILKENIIGFPHMMELREIVLDEKMMVLGGNQRLRVLHDIGEKKAPYKIFTRELAKKVNAKRKENGLKTKTYKALCDDFIIIDNLTFGAWDWDTLAKDWPIATFPEAFGINAPTKKNTELLSKLEYRPLYYQPKELPHINLSDCIDTTKFDAKIKALDEFKLTKKQKQQLTWFAYRFIKIDFEHVANYYAFNASQEEKKALERLRMVLTDDGVDGYIQDDLIRITDIGKFDFTND